MKIQLLLAGAAMAGVLSAQQIRFPASLDKLADKASESVNVTLDPQTLGFASRFLSDSKKDEADAKKVVGKLRSIVVRSFEFDKEGVYSDADVNEIRAQVKGPEWSQIVSARSKKEISEIYLHKEGGLLILVAEPRELTIVNIVGQIDPSDLSSIGGQFGVPRSVVPRPQKDKEKDKNKDKDEDEE